MPRFAHMAALLAAAASLAAPAAAGAAQTLVVDPAAGGSSCSGTTCPSIGSAVQAANAGDTIEVRKGTYAESVTVAKAISIEGAGPGDVKVTGAGTGDVLSIEGDPVSVSGMTIEVPAGGGSAVSVADGATAALSEIVATRGGGAGGASPVVDVAGTARLARLFVTQTAGAGAPAVASTGTGGIDLADSVVLSTTGPGLLLTESAGNRIVRSTLASTVEGGEGMRFEAADSAADKAVVADSTFVVGGPKAAALRVVTTGAGAGDVTLRGRHLTVFGAEGAVLDATGAQGPKGVPPVSTDEPSGSIAATFIASIVQGPSSADAHEGGLLTAPNEAEISFVRSDTSTDPARLFVPGTLDLRADAPVIDRGGAVAADESGRDAHGEPRVDGAASDMGADEFHNKPPVARFGIANAQAKENEDVGFISGSTDPEQSTGGGIAEYRWDFGDGTRQTTSELGVFHRYRRAGVYNVTLQVVDRQGAVSAVSEPQTVLIGDGTPPRLTITVPTQGQRVRLRRAPVPVDGQAPRKRRSRPLTVLGTMADPSGLKSVELSLRLVKRARRAGAAASGRCRFYSGRRLVRKPCDQPVWVKAKLRGNGFRLRTRKGFRLPPGRYALKARGTDNAGNASSGFSKRDGTLVKFRIR